MSWTAGNFTFPEKTSIPQMDAEIYDSLVENRGRMEPVSQMIKLLDTEVLESEEAAENYLRDNQKLYSRDFNYGVRYLNYDGVKPTKKMEDLLRRIEETEKKKQTYAAEHSVNNFKSEYVGCPKCGSKLKATLVKGDKCPLCGKDLRSSTTLTKLIEYDLKKKALRKEYAEEQKKMKAKAKVYWFVSASMYIG